MDFGEPQDKQNQYASADVALRIRRELIADNLQLALDSRLPVETVRPEARDRFLQFRSLRRGKSQGAHRKCDNAQMLGDELIRHECSK
jgi:hypothetical protein